MTASFTALNMDRRQTVSVCPGDQAWQDAPQAPIRRWPLEREAPESGQVTSLVEYLPGARFPEHRHPNGEEILVLSGVFSDEGGDYPAGSYLRSPAGSGHSPFSRSGCVIFVKLNQFAEGDNASIRSSPQQQDWQPLAAHAEQAVLHRFDTGHTALWRYASGQPVRLPEGLVEVLVIEGSLSVADSVLPARSWLRTAAGHELKVVAAAGTLLLIKHSSNG